MPLNNLKLISAGAGSGKTYRLTQELTQLLTAGEVKPSGIIATTFTKRAAAELRERVRVELLRKGMSREANELKNALIGTVHGLGVKLLKRFAFEAGVSPQVDIIADQDHQRLFNLSMANAISVDDIDTVEALCERLSLSKDGQIYNWRKEVLRLVEVLRGNNFSSEDIRRSKEKSWAALAEFLPEPNSAINQEQFTNRLKIALTETIAALENNEADSTKTTQTVVNGLKRLSHTLKRGEQLPWAECCNLARLEKKVGAKSRGLVDLAVEVGELHTSLPPFQADIKAYMDYMYDFALEAIEEYNKYKKARGRIDYTDMEVLVLDLLDNPMVQGTLRDELDLLIVDEFQDTSPIQLALFLKLSQLAKQSIWVGDPKQSIYGFRGAEPRLMKAVMEATGPIKPENIQTKSWRSREDIVHACNAIFTKGFPDIPEAAVVLEPVRTRKGGEFGKPAESPELAERSGIIHWHFNLEAKQRYAKDWYLEMTAKAIAEMLANPPLVVPKDGSGERKMIPSDIAALCRTNYECVSFAKALAKQGMSAAIARNGLLATAEATLLLACLKYLLNQGDSLSVAEILLLGSRLSLKEIIEDRLNYLETLSDDKEARKRWGEGDKLLVLLNDIREKTGEFSTNELINILLEQLDLRRIVVAWGDGEQRLSNIDEMRRLAVEYEDNCHRQHRAASLPGYLLFLDQLMRDDRDKQGAGERPDAVNVLTYHKSKGLEWPAVIALMLDQKLRAEVWGLAVVPEVETVDLEKPLANRWIKYWVKPYGTTTSGVGWLDALQESQWQETATEEARAEEARLLYVGLTRARDYLIMPTAKPGAPWLDRVFERGGGLVPVLDPASTDAPFDWNGHEVTKYLKTWTEPRNLAGTEMSYHEVPFLVGPRPGREDHTPLGPDQTWLLNRYGARNFDGGLTYHSLPEFDPEINERILSQAIGAFLAGDTPLLPPYIREERARELLKNYLPTHDITADFLVRQSDAFHQWSSNKGARPRVRRAERIQAVVDGRLCTATIDYRFETSSGPILIREIHQTLKVFEENKDQRDIYLAELGLLQEMVEPNVTEKPIESYLHLPSSGRLYKLL